MRNSWKIWNIQANIILHQLQLLQSKRSRQLVGDFSKWFFSAGNFDFVKLIKYYLYSLKSAISSTLARNFNCRQDKYRVRQIRLCKEPINEFGAVRSFPSTNLRRLSWRRNVQLYSNRQEREETWKSSLNRSDEMAQVRYKSHNVPWNFLLS